MIEASRFSLAAAHSVIARSLIARAAARAAPGGIAFCTWRRAFGDPGGPDKKTVRRRGPNYVPRKSAIWQGAGPKHAVRTGRGGGSAAKSPTGLIAGTPLSPRKALTLGVVRRMARVPGVVPATMQRGGAPWLRRRLSWRPRAPRGARCRTGYVKGPTVVRYTSAARRTSMQCIQLPNTTCRPFQGTSAHQASHSERRLRDGPLVENIDHARLFIPRIRACSAITRALHVPERRCYRRRQTVKAREYTR